MRHEDDLKQNPRMAMQIKNLMRLNEPMRKNIAVQATAHRNAQC
jgi:deoxyribodipyrimidine photolyase-related protein